MSATDAPLRLTWRQVAFALAVFGAMELLIAWNTRAEPTCHWKRYEPADAWETECGEMLTWAPEGFPPYCPSCGAKVVDDEHQND